MEGAGGGASGGGDSRSASGAAGSATSSQPGCTTARPPPGAGVRGRRRSGRSPRPRPGGRLEGGDVRGATLPGPGSGRRPPGRRRPPEGDGGQAGQDPQSGRAQQQPQQAGLRNRTETGWPAAASPPAPPGGQLTTVGVGSRSDRALGLEHAGEGFPRWARVVPAGRWPRAPGSSTDVRRLRPERSNVDRPEEDQVGPGGHARDGAGLRAGARGHGRHRRLQPVGRGHQLGPGALQEMQLAVEASIEVDASRRVGPSSRPGPAPRSTRREEHDDHERQSPRTYLPCGKTRTMGPHTLVDGREAQRRQRQRIPLVAAVEPPGRPAASGAPGPSSAGRNPTSAGVRAAPPPAGLRPSGPTIGRPADLDKGRSSPRRPRGVSTSATGPRATTRPRLTRAAWVVPRGICSMWWVTRTIGGGRHRRLGRRPGDQSFPGPEVESGRRLVQQEELGPAGRRPGQQDLLALALRR